MIQFIKIFIQLENQDIVHHYCDQKCNFYEEDEDRNFHGVVRSFMPCNATHVKTTECVEEDKMRDGKYDCRNRADEEAFQTGIGNSSSLLLNFD